MGNGDFDWELQGTLFRLFRDDGAIQGIALRAQPPVKSVVVCDFVPPQVTFPFIKIGDGLVLDIGDKSAPGSAVMSTIYLFSRAKDNNELSELSQAIRRILHEKPIRITNGLMVQSRFHSSNQLLDSDGITRRKVLHYYFFLSETIPTPS